VRAVPASAPDDPIATFAPGVFNGRCALITGGGRGIGRATALGFARLGADVAVAGRTEDELRATADEIEREGRRSLVIPTDIREVEAVEAMVEQVWSELGGAHFVVNNAGGQFPARPSQVSDRGWRSVVDLNLNGTWNVCSRVVPRLIELGYGSIVNMVHIQSYDRGAPTFIHSGAARAGVVNMTKTMATYLAHHDITVNAIAPGAIDTAGFREKELAELDPDMAAVVARIVADTPAGRLASPDETAAQILFLCSPAARFITGQSLVADGGMINFNWNNTQWPEMDW
jgi:NAD(P)-dependent dehydrogenase (short-subunit alcohol dehydrogenase family)